VNPLFLKIVGTLLMALSVFSLMCWLFAGGEHAIVPWPVALVVVAIGAFLVKQSRGLTGWTRGSGADPRSASRREVSRG